MAESLLIALSIPVFLNDSFWQLKIFSFPQGQWKTVIPHYVFFSSPGFTVYEKDVPRLTLVSMEVKEGARQT